MNVKDYIDKRDYETERCSIGKNYWYTKRLIEHCRDLPVFELDLAGVDLDVMPWELRSVFEYIKHFHLTSSCSLEYPVIMSPAGWVMNGWHRIAKAIIEGKKTVKAVRFLELPKPDGLLEDE